LILNEIGFTFGDMEAPLTRVCKKCGEEKPLDEFVEIKLCNYGRGWSCKKCVKEYGKKYRERPYVKKRHRDQMAQWRKDNPEEALEISRKSYANNGHKHNAIRKEKYHSDPEYRELKKASDRKYTKTGRRNELYAIPENRLKNIERSRRYKENNKDKVIKSQKKYRLENADYLHKLHKKCRAELRPAYIAQTMRMSVKDLTPEIIAVKRTIIQIRRELTQNNVKTK